jgi:multiphosphoryl transfer protein
VVGIVLVSHSRTLADGIAELARGMGDAGDGGAGEGASGHVPIAVAGGIDDPEHPLGTDAVRVQEAIEEVWSEDGVLVLMDLGSAVLSAEMALDMLPDDKRGKVRLSQAPIVEGAVAAVVASKLGESLERVAEEASGGLAGKAAQLGAPALEPASSRAHDDVGAAMEGDVLTATLRIDNPLGLHARPAARFVQTAGRFDADVTVRNLTAGRGPVPARSLNGVATLGVRQGHEIEVAVRGPQAADAMGAVRDLVERNFDEPLTLAAPPPPAPAPSEAASREATPLRPGTELRGLPASPGIALGSARRFRIPDLRVPEEPAADRDDELRALDEAIDASRRDIVRTRETVAARGADYDAAIFDAHLLFLDDEALVEPARRDVVNEGRNAADAWNRAAERLREQWASLEDEYLRERAGDLRSVADQVLAHLLGVERPLPTLAAPGILVADDLTPAETAGLDREIVLGVATGLGGPTSHSAILARSLGIPAVVGLGPSLAAIQEDTKLLLDGDAGSLRVDPSQDEVQEAERRRDGEVQAARQARAAAALPAVTRDGARIEVVANVGSPKDVPTAVEAGAEGVGLLRTEFLFLEADHVPDEEEQEAAYRAVAEALDGRPLIVRTLDVGADKPLPFLPRRLEANPALGVRGLRLGLARPEVLETQLRAVLRVAVDHPVRVMFPMVATSQELREAIVVLDRARDVLAGRGATVPQRVEVGVMVEVPAAALAASTLAPDVDFFSIGTNDLAQYTMAADRGNEQVAALADAMHPAVLRLVHATVEAARDCGRWVGVCGELAGDVVATPVLVGLGVTELSMAPASIPFVKEAIRDLELPEAQALAQRVIDLDSAAAVRSMARDALGG